MDLDEIFTRFQIKKGRLVLIIGVMTPFALKLKAKNKIVIKGVGLLQPISGLTI